MDVQDILDKKIKALPPGPHHPGLAAARSHIEAAVRHLERGQTGPDDTLFTDVIFRCNQAFEGSVKEAYRVLAGKDPQKKTPANIEQFISSNKLLRKKVLDQFTNYRQEWRNPSTHDYTLDFDEDEALIAIVSVTVFAIVLCDQIDGKLAFLAAAAGSAGVLSKDEKAQPLLDLVTGKVLLFATEHVVGPSQSPAQDYYRLEGSLAGHLAAELVTATDLTISQNARIGDAEADIVVSRGLEKVVVELKRTSTSASVKTIAQRAVTNAARYLHEINVIGAVAFVYSPTERKYAVRRLSGTLAERVRVVVPSGAN